MKSTPLPDKGTTNRPAMTRRPVDVDVTISGNHDARPAK